MSDQQIIGTKQAAERRLF